MKLFPVSQEELYKIHRVRRQPPPEAAIDIFLRIRYNAKVIQVGNSNVGKETAMSGGKHLLGRPKGYHIFGTAKVGEKGQIVIPKEARTLFHVEAGDTLLILGDEKNGIIVTKPDVIRDAATKVFENLRSEEDTRDGDL